MLGYPDAALADVDQAVSFAIDIDHAATLMFALSVAPVPHMLCGDYAKVKEISDRFLALADEKRAAMWKAYSVLHRGSLLALTGSAADAVHTITAGIAAQRSTGATLILPWFLSYLAQAHANLGRFDDAWIAINEAVTATETTLEAWCAAEIHRIAGAIALMSPEPNATSAESCFDRALAIARAQQAKSWELRAAMSMARLWRDQGKRRQAHDLLAPVYGWFTEGFDTLDLKEAKALLEELAS
jgi:predicted ATPase